MANMNKRLEDRKKFWIFKAPIQLKAELDRIRIERIKRGKDNQIQSYNRLGLAISRHEKLLNDLIIADLKNEDLR